MTSIPKSLKNKDIQFLTFTICGEYFGVPVSHVKDIFKENRITPVPLAPADIVGAINLRGRIVVAIDMRKRFNLPDFAEGAKKIHVAIEHKEEVCSLLVDAVEDVITLPQDGLDSLPTTMEEKWSKISDGVYRLQNRLMIVLNIANTVNAHDFNYTRSK